MSEQTLLPPHTESAEGDSPGNGFNLSAHADRLKAQPKEHYEQPAEPPPPPPPEPEPAKEPEGGGEGPKSTADDGASARFIIDMYDAGVSKLSEAMVDEPGRYPAKYFAMEPMLKEHAVAQLAKGMQEGGGKWKMPWWVALLIVLLFHGGLTWAAVRSAKREKADRKAQDKAKANERDRAGRAAPSSGRGEPSPAGHTPFTIIDRNGNTLHPRPPASAAAHTTCQREGCNTPVKRGRKYCSQQCAGLATRGRRRDMATPEPPRKDTPEPAAAATTT
ncbi:MAG TPA: hypothetical protein PL010_14775 [Flavobacteriales bacterium]|nr:hypothetical protein [Flavobacteriales bacterium]HNA33094.1 hypothetical protein [Flavobacteriales bacterium]HNI05885.1 hypothetical protein [Flavobacteriales bacterium]HNK40935.1 hypothetical protein [Flavobacteriales bacterium]